MTKETLNNLIEDTGKFEAILSAIGEGIVIINLSKEIIYQNDKALEMFGDHVGKRCFSIYKQDDTPCEDCPATECIRNNATKHAIHSGITDDALHYYELTIAPIRESGKVVGTVEVIRDITERKLLEEELQRTTRRLKTVINKMKDGLLYANRRDKVAIANDFALDFFTVQMREDLSAESGEVANPSKKTLQKVINAFKSDSDVNYYEKKIQLGKKWYNVGFSASRSSSGIYYGTIVNITDITGLKSLEELKDSLTNMIVHDMKNPLNTIIYVLDMVAGGMMEGISDNNMKLFDIAHKDSKILLSMVQQMLDVSKMEEGEHIIAKSETYFKRTIANSISQVDFLAVARGVNIKESYKTDRVTIDVDEGYLDRVMVNLLSNAVKFSKEGSDILVLAFDVEKNGKNYLQISVANAGKIIPQKEQKNIFDKYKQAERRSSGQVASTGLGLTFCKLATEAHGGTIWVESPPEEFETGAKFSFTIPV